MKGRLYFASDKLAVHVQMSDYLGMDAFKDADGSVTVDDCIKVHASRVQHRTLNHVYEQGFKSGNSYVSSAEAYYNNDTALDSQEYNKMFGHFQLKNWRVLMRPQTDGLTVGTGGKTEIPPDPISDMRAQMAGMQNSLQLLHQKTDRLLDHLKLLK